ncbi:MAG: winged helix-turn-helix domain-containing protein [Proteobacteria bacterium]|nr:winged helix-turn-helix domain-containing protein [Pseudomonadota bacterium]
MPTREDLFAGFTLGDWEVLPGKGVLRRGDDEERPEPKVFEVLIALAMRDGNLVTRDDLVNEVWDGRPTSDEPINRCLSQLRGHLDDRQRPHHYVETLQRRGYRLVQRVELHKKPEQDPLAGTAPETGPSLTLWKVVAAILATGFITIAVVTWIPNVPVRSIAVMPFENLSGAESDQYLVSGFKEELVQTLHNIPDFTVKNGRVSYEKETSEIAEMLNVESVLFGSVHRDGDRLIIRYQISRNGKTIAADKLYGKVDEIFGLQAELAVMVRNKLVGKSTQTLIKSRPTDSEAYDSYMRGIYALEHRGDPGNLEAAVELFQDAIGLDESYGPSYLGLATAYAIMVDYLGAPLDEMHRRAFETVEKGINFDPIIDGAAGAIYGYIYHKEKRWAKSEEAYLGAVNAGIVDSNAFNWYSRMLASVGRLDAALVQAQRAVELDPSSGLLNSRVAIAYTWLGDAENAHEFFARSKDLGWVGATHLVAYALLLTREGKIEASRDLLIAGVDMFGARSDWAAPFFAAMSDPSMAPKALQALDAAAAEHQVKPFIEIVARAFLGDLDGAMGIARLLEQPGEFFEMDILYIPELRALRQHPDFMPLLARLGVVDYWASVGCVWADDRVSCERD